MAGGDHAAGCPLPRPVAHAADLPDPSGRGRDPFHLQGHRRLRLSAGRLYGRLSGDPRHRPLGYGLWRGADLSGAFHRDPMGGGGLPVGRYALAGASKYWRGND